MHLCPDSRLTNYANFCFFKPGVGLTAFIDTRWEMDSCGTLKSNKSLCLYDAEVPVQLHMMRVLLLRLFLATSLPFFMV